MEVTLKSFPALPRDDARSAPEPKRRGPPVLIHDAIIPYRGETLLLALLRRDAEAE